MRFRVLCAIGAACAATALPPAASALTVTLDECTEGADFIRNAALSRDNGIRAEEFLRRLEDDLVAIQSVPPALRFVKLTDLLRSTVASSTPHSVRTRRARRSSSPSS